MTGADSLAQTAADAIRTRRRGAGRWLALTALVAGWVIVARPADAAPPEKPAPTPEAIARYFETIVFGAEIDKSLASKVVAKWSSPQTISLQGQRPEDYRDIVEDHVRTLRRLTKMKIDVLPPGRNDGNVTIAFVPRASMSRVKIPQTPPHLIARLAAPGGCYFVSFKNPPERIFQSVIVVNNEREKTAIRHCLLEELTQSMGLPNDSDDLRPSLFSDHDHLLAPSRVDTILIKTLYDPRMKAGLPRDQAMKVAREIIAELDVILPR